MRILAILFLVFLSCENVTKKNDEQNNIVVDSTELNAKSYPKGQANLISDGIWISTIDSLSTVEISGKKWVFKYKNDESVLSDYYVYAINESVFDKDSSIVDGSLILTKESDTLKYAIEYISDKYMTLLYLPRGNFQKFRKKE